MSEITTEYDSVKEIIFAETMKVNKRLKNDPSNEKLLGAREALVLVMDKAALLDEFDERCLNEMC